MSVTVDLVGFKELEQELDRLSKAAGKGVLRRGLKKAAEPMAELANSYAPVGETGEYAESFVYSTKLNKRQSGVHRKMFRNDKAAVEGFVGTNNPAGVQQEFGNIHHGPQPALRPAWDEDSGPFLDRLGQELWREFEKSVKRAERKAAREAAKG
ncbi:HK97 gp10 family phage protein [Pontibaca salina]|uniref:HK97 gp10 family phage protein n=1 Tax=Pontibaca salina TaxID=2795731 RepID=A0A934HQH9_9RHOB|nr:HK97 gp10 family phage protein [Pontibaca salina]MBI6628328.1 HK97 gp10 family phage protein [Pontibaca salina]